ncbi:MAG: signal peptide peptidase SppA [Planctomyces sp.]|nr:signal peptide peptidase SppA [Planctomyces sp.]
MKPDPSASNNSASNNVPQSSSPAKSATEQVVEVAGNQITIRVENVAAAGRPRWFVAGLLLVSIGLNLWLLFSPSDSNYERARIPRSHVSGEPGADSKIAIINVTGTISPPFTERWIREIQAAADDDQVKGVILAIDSPGGLVADSHQILREIQKLVRKKPVSVAMKRLAASGGYYIAMGIGPEGVIYAEPTTWTGSIGVIIPRYNAAELAQSIGVRVEPLATGPMKDSLNPFRDLKPEEQKVWDAILADAFDRFVGVIDAGRSQLDDTAVRALATGQLYTAQQAVDNHLVDQIGYTEDAVEAMAAKLQLAEYEVFEYRQTPGLVDAILGANTQQPSSLTEQFLESTVPKAMYYCSWNPWPK